MMLLVCSTLSALAMRLRMLTYDAIELNKSSSNENPKAMRTFRLKVFGI
jgi:hypothetical protein